MKNNQPLTLPATPYVQEILQRIQPFNGWSKAKARIDKHVPLSLPWTLHDLRRTHSTMQARLGTPIHVTERILSHTGGTISGVAAIYNQHDYLQEAREALERLEECVQGIVAQGSQP